MDDTVLQDAAAVRVAVRVRPLITRELLQGSKTCISTDGACVTIGRDRRFTFDHAFGPTTQQEQVYRELVSPLVESCFEGFNVTVLAYGQTGSGKTFTMGTGECGVDEHQMGIAPRVIRHVFEGIEARKQQASFYVRAQFLEIYNEDVKDLLVPPTEQAIKWISREQTPGSQASGGGAWGGGGGGGITLRDAGDGNILVVGAMEESAQCAEDLVELLERGMALRATSSTCANEQSSRSHAILTIIIEQHLHATSSWQQQQQQLRFDKSDRYSHSTVGPSPECSTSGAAGQGRMSYDDHNGGTGEATPVEIRTAKLHLVDLAGSERTKQLRTSMQGPRFRETVNINQGLLALGNVISALGDERRRGSHVPYRESKLTRLLQDSLGGNSRTAMIACVSPADDVLEETLNTLKYANRAKNIRNKPIVNRALPASDLALLGGAVQQLQLQVLQQLAAQMPDGVLARGLPLAELLALDASDPTACLDVLGRMKSALAASGASSLAASMDGGALGRQLLAASLASPRNMDGGGGGGARGPAAAGVEALVSGCSRAIAGILHGLAEMEAQGHINREAREHILRSLDASTLRLLPVVRSLGHRASQAHAPASPLQAGAAMAAKPKGGAGAGTGAAAREVGGSDVGSLRSSTAGGGAGEASAGHGSNGSVTGSSERELELEARIRHLETELSNCRAEVREAQDDLERDEVIFADKMKELQEAQASNFQLKQRLDEAEERHSKEMVELRRQVGVLQAAVNEGQLAAGRSGGGAPFRQASRGRLRRGSTSGSVSGCLPAARRRSATMLFTALRVGAGEGENSATAADETGNGAVKVEGSSGGGVADEDGAGGEEGGHDGEGERGAEEDEVLYDEELLSYISETDYTELHRREVLESDAALREELAEVLREKAAAEAERAALERAALAQRSSFDEARAKLEEQLSWLSGSIGAQQQQLQAAQAAEREARELAAKWQERAEELEAAIEAREEALRELRSELDSVESNAMRSAEERAALRQQYEQRIAAVVAQVSTLQRQLQQHVATTDRRERQQSSERAAALEAELTRMRSQQAELRRQLSERVARYERESTARLRELATLRKAAASARSRMATLEQENRAQRQLLRAKQQQVLAAEQRLRDSQRNGTTRSRSSSPGSRAYLARPGSGTGIRSNTSSADSNNDGGGIQRLQGQRAIAQGGAARAATTLGIVTTAGGGGGGGGGGNRFKSPSPIRQRPHSQPSLQEQTQVQRQLALRTSSLKRLEDIAAEELPPSLGRANSNPARTSNASPVGRNARQQQQEQQQQREGPALLSPQEQAELAEWAEQMLALVGEVAGGEARVEVLDSRHRELLNRRELLMREHAQFALRTRRRAEQAAQAVAACEAELEDLAARAVAVQAERASAGGGPVAEAGPEREPGAKSTKEWMGVLQQRMAEVRHARDLLQGRLRSGRLLDDSEQQILDSLDDQLDDLETQLSYVAGELADRRASLSQLQRRREQLQERAIGMGAAGLRLALGAATEAVGQRAFQVRQLEAALAASEAGAARREAQLQYRLRESLVSLSAHLASLEATSPSSSACLNSSELRNLLGIYLDMDLGATPGNQAASGAGSSSATGHKGWQLQQQQAGAPASPAPRPQPSRPITAVDGGEGGGGGGGGSSGTDGNSDGKEKQQQQQQQERRSGSAEEPELAEAESLALWGNKPQPQHQQREPPKTRFQPPKACSSALDDESREGLVPDLSLRALPASRPDPAAAAAAAWPAASDIVIRRPQQQQLRDAVLSEIREQGFSLDGRNAVPFLMRTSSPRILESENSAGKVSDGGAVGLGHRLARSSSQLRLSGSSSQGGVAPPSPTGGILRRAGSMESVGGSVGSTTKRVTWSSHIAIDPTNSSNLAAPLPPPALAGDGGSGGIGVGVGVGCLVQKGKERSILDRDGGSMWMVPAAAAMRRGNVNANVNSANGGPGVMAAATVSLRTSDGGIVPGQARDRETLPSRREGRGGAWLEVRLANAVENDYNDGDDNKGMMAIRNPSSAGGGGRCNHGSGAGDGNVLRCRSSSDGGSDRHRSSSDGGSGGGRGGTGGDGIRRPMLVISGSSFTSMSLNVCDSDGTTVAASDAKALPEEVAPDEAGAKSGVRSFNPWRGCAGSHPGPAQVRTTREHESFEQQQQHGQNDQQQPSQQQKILGVALQPQDIGSHGSHRRSGEGDDDLLSAQDSDYTLRSEDGGGDSPGREQRHALYQQQQQRQWPEPPGPAVAVGSPNGGAIIGVSGGGGAGGSMLSTAPAGQEMSGPEMVVVGVENGASGYGSSDDELEEHVRLLELAAASAAAVATAPTPRLQAAQQQQQQRRLAAPSVLSTPTPRLWGGNAAKADVASTFRHAAVFEQDSDSDVFCISADPTPREPAIASAAKVFHTGKIVAPPNRAARSGRPSLDGPSKAAVAAATNGARQGRSDSSAPLPLQAPARSISPSPHNFIRQQRPKSAWPGPSPSQAPAPAAPAPGPAAAVGPGSFMAPKPAVGMTTLTEALLPYKAHLKRTASVQGASRVDTPEGRRAPSAAPGIKANFNSPQTQRYVSPSAWQMGSGVEEFGGGSAAAYSQRQLQQPWRNFGPG